MQAGKPLGRSFADTPLSVSSSGGAPTQGLHSQPPETLSPLPCGCRHLGCLSQVESPGLVLAPNGPSMLSTVCLSLGVVVHTCTPSTQEAKTGASL